jgi:molybdenum cofactor cytidylyltransferase
LTAPTVIVLASGRGERFIASGGTGSKLNAVLAGKTVLQHTLAAVKLTGLPWHLEDSGQAGMGDSIAAAVRSTPDAAGWLVLPGDLPLIQGQTLLAIAAALQQHRVVLPSYRGQRGHPVGFAADCRQALLDLSGEQGAVGVVRRHAAVEVLVEDAGCIQDIDTLDDLLRAERWLLAARLAKTGENG